MPRPICSPRHQNILDFVNHLAHRGCLEARLHQRFLSVAEEEAQRGPQDLGLGLCGQTGRRLARSLSEVSCNDCLRLVSPQVDHSETAG